MTVLVLGAGIMGNGIGQVAGSDRRRIASVVPAFERGDQHRLAQGGGIAQPSQVVGGLTVHPVTLSVGGLVRSSAAAGDAVGPVGVA